MSNIFMSFTSIFCDQKFSCSSTKFAIKFVSSDLFLFYTKIFLASFIETSFASCIESRRKGLEEVEEPEDAKKEEGSKCQWVQNMAIVN